MTVFDSFVRKAGAVALVSGLLLFGSCEVGLGAAIDTKNPELTITLPEPADIVRSTFTMKGTYSDDGEIESVTVELQDTATKKIIASKEADFAENEWCATFDPEKDKIPDGSYQANVVIADTFKHKTELPRAFRIDNTPPVIVLTSPKTTDMENPHGYGKLFTIEGKAADDNNVDSVKIEIFEADPEMARAAPVKTVTINSVSTTISLDVADWDARPESGEDLNVYKSIYGQDIDGGDKNYYLKITAYDEARLLGDKESLGNGTTTFFMSKEVEAVKGFKPANVYKLNNGSLDEKDFMELAQAIKEKKHETATFCLNPVNNPTFQVSGMEVFEPGVQIEQIKDGDKQKVNPLSAEIHQFTNKNDVTIQVFSGRDNYEVLEDTLGYYLVETDDNGVVLLSEGKENRIPLLKPYKDKEGNILVESDDDEVKASGSTKEEHAVVTLSGSAYSATLTIDATKNYLEVGHYYVFDVTGYDTQGNRVSNIKKNSYGIKIVTSATAPTMTITEPGGTKLIKKSEGFVVKGTAVVDEGDVDVLIYLNKVEGSPIETITATKADEYAFEYEVPANINNNESFKILVVGKLAQASQTAQQEIQVTNDLKDPEFGSITVSPKVLENSKEYVNGKIEIKASVSDDRIIGESGYSLDGGETWVRKEKSDTMITISSLDTTKWPDEEKVIAMYVQDQAGNRTDETITLNIKQDTDKPKIELNNTEAKKGISDFNLADIFASKGQSNMFGTNSNNMFMASVTDDDGIGKIQLGFCKGEIWKDSAATWNTISESLYKDKTSYSIKSEVPAVEGTYSVKLIVTDNKKETSSGNYETTVGPYVIAVDNGAPSLVIKSESETWQSAGETFKDVLNSKNGVWITTDDKAATIARYTNAACTTGETVLVNNNGTVLDSFTTKSDEGEYSCWYKATDIYGNSTVSSAFIYSVDKTKPDLSAMKFSRDGSFTDSVVPDAWTKSNSLYVKSNVTDAGGSEVASVSYLISADSKTEDQLESVSLNDWTEIKPFNVSKKLTLSSGKNYIYLKALDNAGNVKYSAGLLQKLDDEAPAIELTNPNATTLVNRKSNVSVSGTFAESGIAANQSGIKSVKLYKNSVSDANLIAHSDGGGITLNKGDGTFTGVFAKESIPSTGSSFVVFAVVEDIAGNTGKYSTNVGMDVTAPEVIISSPVKGSTVNKTISLNGSATDTNSVAKVQVFYKSSLTEWTQIGSDITGTAVNPWSVDLDTTLSAYNAYDADGTLPGTQMLVKVEATDSAGNTTSSNNTVLFTIDQNTDRPVIKLGNIKAETGTINNSLDVSVDVSDDDGLSGLVLKVYSGASAPSSWGTVPAVSLDNGKGIFTPANKAEGSKSLYFYIKDAKNGEFITKVNAAGTDLYGVPYIVYSDNTKTDNAKVISYIYDNTPPVFKTKAFGFGASGSAAITAAKDSGSPSYAALGESILIGGTKKKYVVFAITPNDLNGIKSITCDDIPGTVFTVSDNTKNGNTVWYSNAIDSADISKSSILLKVTDESGLSDTASVTISIDNLSPSVTKTSPDEATEVTGDVNMTGSYQDEGGSGISVFKYLVLNDSYYTGTPKKPNASLIENAFRGTVPAGGNVPVNYAGPTGSSWNLVLKNLPADDAALADYSFVNHSSQQVYSLPVYFYIEDALGNYSVSNEVITYNPYGLRPVAEVNYPAGDFSDPANMNGAIRLSGSAAKGTAEGAESAAAVYLQFDVNRDNIFDESDLALLEANYGTYLSVSKDADVKSELSVSALDKTAINNSFWGIKANKIGSWYYTINTNMEFQNDDTDKSGALKEGKEFIVGVRAVAVTTTGVFGAWSDSQYIKLDTNIPVVGEDTEQIVEYSGDSSSVISATRTYETDMFLKGKTALQVSVADVEGISKVMYYIASTKAGLNASSASVYTMDLTSPSQAAAKTFADGKKGYVVTIPLSTSSSTGTKWIKVQAYKENESSAYAVYNVNFDNTAPAINDMMLNSVSYTDSDKKIVNSNGTFTLSGRMTDDGSGYERAAFYFVRGDVTNYAKRIYDPMTVNKAIQVQAKGSASLVSGITAMQADGTFVTNSNATSVTGTNPVMYGYKQNVTVSSNGNKVTLSLDNANIKAGGLIYISGTYIRINEKVGKVLTLEKATTATGTVSAFFPVLQVVDNTGAEKTDTTGLNVTSGDDGDGMPESIIKSQNKWTWDATIQSQNIPDGPGKMVILVWDKAGNVSAETYEVSVQNKAPRLVQLHLGTDITGDGKYSDSEFVSYDVLEKTGEQRSYRNMETSAYRGKSFRIKDKLAVVPEFVGGNISYGDKDIKLVLNNAAETDENYKSSSEELIASDKSKISGTSLESNRGYTKVEGINVRNNLWCFEIENQKLGEESTSDELAAGVGERAMSFTFWDSTEDTTQGIDSCYCFLRISDLIVDVIDTDQPVVTIKPFYWNDRDDCSAVISEEGEILGHIDIESEPTELTRPAVSGQVKIEGTAYDNTRLGKIYMKAPDGVEKQVAEFNDGVWSEVKTDWPENWKKFEITKDYGITQEGHIVEWCFTIDMTVYGVAVKKTVDVKADDAAETPNTSAPSAVQTLEQAQTSHYIMDFVPYIKGISGATRSRLGRYPVQAGSVIQIEGMNFAETSTYSVAFKRSNGTTASTVADENVTKVTDGIIEVKAPNYSAYVEVTVDGVVTKNNTNANEKWNIEEGDWKKGDLKAGANYWTDDRYLSVWNVDTTFIGSINPHRGTIKKIQQKDTGSGTGKHVRDAPLADTLGGGVIYKQPGSSTQVDTLVNQTGHYYAAYSSDDLKVYGHVSSKSYAEHGDNVMFNSSEAAYQTPADEFDYTIVAGVPYYVVQDSWISGDSANVWGTGLFISKEGAWWDRSYNAKYGTDIQEDQEYYVIERQGASGSRAASRDSSTGYDAVLKQFKNPKIAGWYNPSESVQYTTEYSGQKVQGMDYLYVSYYDSYAKCLKYAAYKIGHRFNENGQAAWFNWQHWGSHNEISDIIPLMHTAPNNGNAATGVEASNNMKTGNAVVAGWDTLQTNPTSFKEKAGEWSDIMVDPSDHFPVIIYYNETKRCLEVAHGKSYAPVSGNICDTSGSASSDKTESGWTKTKNITPNAKLDFGRYVSAEIDADGNIHAAAQDVTNGRLYYIFLKKSGDTYIPEYKLVDATSSVGMWTDIQLNNDVSGNTAWYDYEPVISYLDKSFLNTQQAAKVAFVEKDGKNSCFEAMTDPAKYSANDQKTSIMSEVFENGTSRKAKVAVGYNSDMLALDFLRDEQ